MNVHASTVALALLFCATGAVSAQEPARSLPAVKAQAVLYVADCGHRARPSQREVGEWAGLHNFSQVYDLRERLMAEIGRACHQDGVDQVRVVSRNGGATTAPRLLALAARRGR